MTWIGWVLLDPMRRAVIGPGRLRYRLLNAGAEVVQRATGGQPGAFGQRLFQRFVGARDRGRTP